MKGRYVSMTSNDNSLDDKLKIMSDFFEDSSDIFFITDKEGVIKEINKSVQENLGYSKDYIKNMPIMSFVNNIYTDNNLRERKKFVISNIPKRATYEFICNDMTIKYVEFLITKKENLLFFAGRDISEMLATKRKIQRSNNVLDIVLNNAPISIFWKDLNYNIIGANKEFLDFFGYAKLDEVLNKTVESLNIWVENEECIREEDIRVIYNQETITDVYCKALNHKGDARIIKKTKTPMYENNDIIGVIVIFEDITLAFNQGQKLEFITYHDELTGLYNRNFLQIKASNLDKQENYPLTIAVLDINNLKLFNDVFGHLIGDAMIKKISSVIKKNCRQEDYIIRYGGDEYIIFMPNTQKIKALEILMNIEKDVRESSIKQIPINIAYGFETKFDNSLKFEEVLGKADSKMYTRKTMNKDAIKKNVIENMIKQLFENSPYERKHSKGVAMYAKKISGKLDHNEHFIDSIYNIGLYHDIGKIAIDKDIINKQDKLDDEEWVKIIKHCEVGYTILSASNNLARYAEGVMYHHERYDGKGYPKGLSGEDIPLKSRIIAVADAIETMKTDKAYRNKLEIPEIIMELKKGSGKQFDPIIAKAAIEIMQEELKNKQD